MNPPLSICLALYRRLAYPHEFRMLYGGVLDRLGEDAIPEVWRRYSLPGLLQLANIGSCTSLVRVGHTSPLVYIQMTVCIRCTPSMALAKQYGRHRVLALWGALKKIPQRLLEALRYFLLPEVDFDVKAAARCHISLNSS